MEREYEISAYFSSLVSSGPAKETRCTQSDSIANRRFESYSEPTRLADVSPKQLYNGFL